MALSFMYRQFAYSRFVFIIGTVLAFIILLVLRSLFTTVVRQLLKKGIGGAKTKTVGVQKDAKTAPTSIVRKRRQCPKYNIDR